MYPTPYHTTDLGNLKFLITGGAGFIGSHIAEYLLQFGQSQNNGSFGAEPVFVNSSLQIDLSTSYQFTEQFNAYFEALNITDETQSTHGRYDNELLDVWAYGRRYALGIRYRL